MNFIKVCEIPYGQFDGLNRVYKVYFVDLKYNLFLQGYKVTKLHDNSSRWFVLKKLNELYDFAVVDLESSVVDELFVGDNSVEIANDIVEGFPKLINVNISVTEDSKPQENDFDFLDKITELYAVSPATALMLEMYMFIEKKKSEELILNISEKLLLESVLSQLTYDKSFIETFPSEEAKKRYQDLFPLKLPLTINNLVLYFNLIKLMKDNSIAIDSYSPLDLLFGIRLIKELPGNVVVQNMKQIKINVNKTTLIDFSKSSKELEDKMIEVLSNFYRINNISFKINGKEILKPTKTISYRDMFMNYFNKKHGLAFYFENGFLIMNFRNRTISYKIGDNEYKSEIELDDEMNFISKETAQVELTLINNN